MVRIVVFGLTLALFVMGCGEDVAAPAGVDEPYSIFGVLNPRLEMQTMLVGPTSRFLDDYPDVVDAVVTSTNLETGESIAWRDSVVTGERGQLDHVFWADFRPDFGSRHRIDVIRSDGAASSVELDVPMQVSVEEDDEGTYELFVDILGDAFLLNQIDLVFTLRRHQASPEVCEWPAFEYAVSYTGEDVRTEGGRRVRFNLSRHFDILSSYYAIDSGFDWPRRRFPFFVGPALMQLELRIMVGNEAWNPPGGEFDRGVLAQPGTLSNVVNGFGFVGAGYNQDFALYPSEEAIADTWFFDYIMRPSSGCSDYCMCGQPDDARRNTIQLQ